MSQEQQAMKEQEALKELLSIAQREQSGEKVSAAEIETFINKNKDVFPAEVTSGMEKNLDVMKAKEQQSGQAQVSEQTAPAANAAPNKFNDSMALERTELERGIADKYAERELANTQREAIKGKNSVMSAAIGAGSAAVAMKVLHEQFNDQNMFGKLLKEARKAVLETGEVGDAKLTDTLNIFTKGLGKKFNETSEFADVKKSLKEYLTKEFTYETPAMATKIKSALETTVDSKVKESLGDMMADLSVKTADAADKLSRLKNEETISKELGNLTEGIGEKLAPFVKDNKITKEDAESFVNAAKENIKSFSEEKRAFNNTAKDSILQSVSDLSEKITTKAGVFGEKAKWFAEKFNNINKDGTKTGLMAQVAVVSALVAGTAVMVAGIDSIVKSGSEKKKQELTTDIRKLDQEIAESNVELTSFVNKYASEAANAERSTSFVEKVQPSSEAKNEIKKTGGSFGEKIRAEQSQEAQAAGVSL